MEKALKNFCPALFAVLLYKLLQEYHHASYILAALGGCLMQWIVDVKVLLKEKEYLTKTSSEASPVYPRKSGSSLTATTRHSPLIRSIIEIDRF